jgi:long-chain acyl-CoA synthetase
MMKGYLNSEEETELITIYDPNGIKYYRTGDKGHVTQNGQICVVDRYKRAMMRPDGHTVHATPIENIIMSHEAVIACSVVGIPMGGGAGVIPTAFLTLKNGASDNALIINEIDELCLRKLPGRDKAHAYVMMEKLPYTLMGKIDYRKLESLKLEDLDLMVKDHTFL